MLWLLPKWHKTEMVPPIIGCILCKTLMSAFQLCFLNGLNPDNTITGLLAGSMCEGVVGAVQVE